MKSNKKNKFCKDGKNNLSIQSKIDKLFPQYKIHCITEKEYKELESVLVGINNITEEDKNKIEMQFNKIFKQQSHKTYSSTMYNHLEKIYKLY
mgnify:CR=1 FL=1|tara:strand:+ start:235 stop:513 length:279 start_codon:yes stop_codon:yes gene_type:complete